MDIIAEKKGIPEDLKERMKMAACIADKVRALRRQLDEVAPGPSRKTERKRILLMIDVRQWKMRVLNPKKVRPEVETSRRAP